MRRKIAIFISIFLITLGVIVAATSLSTASADTTTSSNNTSIFCTDPNNCNLDTWMANFYTWSIAIGGALAILVIVWAAYEYATSAGDVEKINKAKEKIVGAILGLILLVLVALILDAVGSRGAENPFKGTGGSSSGTSGGSPGTGGEEDFLDVSPGYSPTPLPSGSILPDQPLGPPAA